MKFVVLLIFKTLHHTDVITIYIQNMISDLRSEYQISLNLYAEFQLIILSRVG